MKKSIETSCNVAEIHVKYKPYMKASERPKITCSTDSVKLFREIWSDTMEMHEEFYILLLNRSNKVLGWYKISQGGISGTVVDSRIIFAIALKALASGIIIAHNHPSGALIPSESDKAITRKLKNQGELLDINILDHVILTAEAYYSFTDDGY